MVRTLRRLTWISSLEQRNGLTAIRKASRYGQTGEPRSDHIIIASHAPVHDLSLCIHALARR